MTIPNILTCIRLVLMPVFVYVYFIPGENSKWWAMVILAFSFFTDVLDGWIARHFNMVSDLGKVLDPIADKIMQITVLICLAFADTLIFWAVVFVFIKELLLGIGVLILTLRGCKSQSSIFAGKFACFISVLVSLILIFPFPQPLPNPLVISMVIVLVGANAVALVTYIFKFFELFSTSNA